MRKVIIQNCTFHNLTSGQSSIRVSWKTVPSLLTIKRSTFHNLKVHSPVITIIYVGYKKASSIKTNIPIFNIIDSNIHNIDASSILDSRTTTTLLENTTIAHCHNMIDMIRIEHTTDFTIRNVQYRNNSAHRNLLTHTVAMKLENLVAFGNTFVYIFFFTETNVLIQNIKRYSNKGTDFMIFKNEATQNAVVLDNVSIVTETASHFLHPMDIFGSCFQFS